MSIWHYFNKSIIIRRQKTTTGYKRSLVSTGTTDAQIQRISTIPDNELYGVRGATHLAWVDIAIDVKEGDDILDAEGKRYSVIGKIVEGEDIAINEHIKLILKEFTD